MCFIFTERSVQFSKLTWESNSFLTQKSPPRAKQPRQSSPILFYQNLPEFPEKIYLSSEFQFHLIVKYAISQLSPMWPGLLFYVWASSRRLQWEPTIRIRLKNSDFWVKRGNAAVAALLIHNIRLGAALRVGIMPRLAFPNMRIQIHPHLISFPDRGKNSASFRMDFYAGNFITCSYFGPWMLRQMRKALAYLKEITNFHFIWCLASPGLEKFPPKMNPA